MKINLRIATDYSFRLLRTNRDVEGGEICLIQFVKQPRPKWHNWYGDLAKQYKYVYLFGYVAFIRYRCFH